MCGKFSKPILQPFEKKSNREQTCLILPIAYPLDRESIASQCMDIYRNLRISKWISIKAWTLKTDIHKACISIHGYFVYGYPYCRMSFHGHPCLIYRCGHSHLYGYLKTDIQNSRISMLISVDFWKSMYGYAMDSRTRVFNLSY